MAIHGHALFLAFSLSILTSLASQTLPESAPAQVVTDGTLGGPAGPVGSGTIPGVGTTTYHITDLLGERAGGNLFHSFSSFNVGTGESATFTGPGGIQNIVSRVTGGSHSWIDGTLRSTIQGANLYFLNPWGVVFGSYAWLDVKGSFHVSTADYLRFEDGLKFYSTPGAADQILSTASPAAFGFLNANPGPVSLQGSWLGTPEGETLSIVGGEIGLDGSYVWAQGGRINLASITSPGEVSAGPTCEVFDLNGQPQEATGSLKLEGASVNTSNFLRDTPAGTIVIRSGRLLLDQLSAITAANYGDKGGGGIEARVGSLDLLGNSLLHAENYGSAHSDGIHIVTGTLDISEQSRVLSDSQGAGTGGPVTIEATEWVHLSDTFSYVSSASWASGDAGSLTISTPELIVNNGAQIYGDSLGDGKAGDVSILVDKLSLLSGGCVSSQALGPTGNGGNILINATEEVLINGQFNSDPSSVLTRTIGAGNAGRIEIHTPLLSIGDGAQIGADTVLLESTHGSLGGTGRAGDIDITVGKLLLTEGGRISSDAYGTTGRGGNITVRATDSVVISGADSRSGIPSGLSSYSWWEGKGDAGNIFVSAPNLDLSDWASIGADTLGEGRGGDIDLTVRRLTLSGGATITSQSSMGGSGRGGDIHVTAEDAVTLSGDYSAISTSSEGGTGAGGDITISSGTLTLQGRTGILAETDGYEGSVGRGRGGDIGIDVASLTLSDGSRISSSSYESTGDGGHVTIQADNDISLIGSGIDSASLGSGKGGDIKIEAATLSLAEGAQITATSKGTGDAGTIDIAVTGSFISRNGKVSTSSKNADGGNIDITAPHMVHLKDSEITASVGGGPATVGGNISIDPQYVILDHSKIIANAYEGQGGNIRIVANVFLADPYSVVDASSALGIDGSVDIRAPITEISGTLVPLGEDFISAFELLREPCLARIRGGKYSSFIVGGRDGLPMEPGRLLPSPMP